MTDAAVNYFVARGTAAERATFTPDPATPLAGPDQGYFFYETDTGDTYAWDGSAWDQVNTGAGAGLDVEDEGTPEASGVTTLNFTGAGVTATDAGGGVVDVDIPGGGSGGLIGVQVITATGAGTYTPTGGTSSIVIELIGGGGGGAGIAAPGGGNGTRSGSGGGGAYLRKRLTADFSGASYSVGAKGAGGASGANNGSAGGDTTFTDTAGSPTVYTAGGGTAGATVSAQPPINLGVIHAGGTATNGDLNVPGGSSDLPLILATGGGGFSGRGGSSQFSRGADPVRINSANSGAAGNNAGGKGGGGSAAYAQGTGGPFAGGDGSDGIIIIWEYS